MARMTEIFVLVSAIAGIATFLGFRAAARKAIRSLGRKPKPDNEHWDEHNERRTHDDLHA